MAAPITGLAIAELPTGEVLIAYMAGGTLSVLHRYEEHWHPAAAVGGGEAADAGAGLALTVHDGGRNRTEDVEQVTAMAAEVTECDAPPEVALRVADRPNQPPCVRSAPQGARDPQNRVVRPIRSPARRQCK